MSHSLRIDPIRCDAFGVCAEIVPELVSLDDWGYPLIEPSRLDGRLLERARRAAEACPALALRLQPIIAERPPHAGPAHQTRSGSH